MNIGVRFLVAIVIGASISRLIVPERPGGVGIMIDAAFAAGILALLHFAGRFLRKKASSVQVDGSAMEIEKDGG